VNALVVHTFVEHVPDKLGDGVVYVSIHFATVIHKCCCGCGHEVVTPLSPSGWQLTFDGESVSLYPSIGNRALPCRSHYWIENNRVRWARWDADDADTKKSARRRRAKPRSSLAERDDAGACDRVAVTERGAAAESTLRANLRRLLHRD
jgi:hypothetical protein